MVYGYCRISTAKQSIERQIRNISEYDRSALIIQEKFTGTSLDRPEWKKLERSLERGDTVIFDSVSRMSRSAEEGFAEYERLYNAGISLVFLKEPHINTSVYKNALNNSIELTGTEIADIYLEATNRVLLILAKNQIKLAFEQAQIEVDQLHRRTREGIATARINGKQIGQRQGAKLRVKKAAPTKELILKYSKSFNGTLNDIECLKLIQISRNTYYKYKRELADELPISEE